MVTRVSYVAGVGGLAPSNLLYFFNFDFMGWLNDYGHPQALNLALLLIFGISALFVSGYYLFHRRNMQLHQSFLYAVVAVIACIYLTSLTVNPQYILWILPFLIICYALYDNYRLRIILLSFFAFTYQLYWAKHLINPLLAYSSIGTLGIYMDRLIVALADSVGFYLMVISGLAGMLLIFSLLFPTASLKAVCRRLKKLDD